MRYTVNDTSTEERIAVRVLRNLPTASGFSSRQILKKKIYFKTRRRPANNSWRLYLSRMQKNQAKAHSRHSSRGCGGRRTLAIIMRLRRLRLQLLTTLWNKIATQKSPNWPEASATNKPVSKIVRHFQSRIGASTTTTTMTESAITWRRPRSKTANSCTVIEQRTKRKYSLQTALCSDKRATKLILKFVREKH